MKRAIAAFVIMFFMTTTQAAVKRSISVNKVIVNDNGVSANIKFSTSFNQKYPVECDLIGKKKRTVRAHKIGKKQYMVFSIGETPKKIRCYYWLK